jgi:hypothetical protein
MPKRLHLEEHLSSEELEYRYRKAKDPVLHTHLLIVWQLSLGKTTREVSEATGYSPEWIREISLRYNKDEVEGLDDRRHQNPGAKYSALLSYGAPARAQRSAENSARRRRDVELFEGG